MSSLLPRIIEGFEAHLASPTLPEDQKEKIRETINRTMGQLQENKKDLLEAEKLMEGATVEVSLLDLVHLLDSLISVHLSFGVDYTRMSKEDGAQIYLEAAEGIEKAREIVHRMRPDYRTEMGQAYDRIGGSLYAARVNKRGRVLPGE